eukprot:Gb_13902 [translate_table: standard]
MVVKDARKSHTGVKASGGRTIIRNASVSPRSENKSCLMKPSITRKSLCDGGSKTGVLKVSNRNIFEGSKQSQVHGSSPVSAKKEKIGAKVEKQMPHYMQPSAGSRRDACRQTPVHVKPLTLPSDVSNQVSRFLKSSTESCHDARKYGTKHSPPKGVKPIGLKTFRAVERSPGVALHSKPKVARPTCSSRLSERSKHLRSDILKEGSSKFEGKRVCPYTYCSLNDQEHLTRPSIKQFIASRRRLLKTPEGLKWKGLNPIPKRLGVSVDIQEKQSAVDTGQRICSDISDFYVECPVKDIRQEKTLLLGDNLCNNCGNCANDPVKVFADDQTTPKHLGVSDDIQEKQSAVDTGQRICSDISDFYVECPVKDIRQEKTLVLGGNLYNNCGNCANDPVKVFADDQTTPKHLGVSDDIQEKQSAVDTGQGICSDISESYVKCPVNDIREEETMVLGDEPCNNCDNCASDSVKVFADDRSPGNAISAPESMECEDYDDGHSTLDESVCEFDADPKSEVIKISESLLDGSFFEFKGNDSINQWAEWENGKDGNFRPGIDTFAHDTAESNYYDYGQINDSDPRCFIHVNALETQSISHTKPDSQHNGSLIELNSSPKSEVKEERDTTAGSLCEGYVSGNDTNDIEQFVDSEDDGSGIGRPCSVVSADENMGCDDNDYDHNRHNQSLVIQVDTFAIQFSSHAEPDGTLDGSVIEINATPRREVQEEYGVNAGSVLNGSDSKLSDNISIKQFAECKDGEGGDCKSVSHANPKSEVIKISESLLDASFFEFKVNDSLNQCAEWENGKDGNDRPGIDTFAHDTAESNYYDYGQINDSDPRCFICVNALETQSISHTKPGSQYNGSLIEVNSSPKNEVKEECDSIAGSLWEGYVSGNDDNNDIEQFVDSEDDGSGIGGTCGVVSAHESMGCNDYDYDHNRHNQSLPVIQVDTFAMQISSHAEPDGTMDGSVIKINVTPRREVQEEYSENVESILNGSDSKFSDNNSIKQFAQCEDGEGADCKSGSDVFGHESLECDDYDHRYTGDSELHCFIQVDSQTQSNGHTASDSPLSGSQFEFGASPQGEAKEEHISIAGGVLDGLAHENDFTEFDDVKSDYFGAGCDISGHKSMECSNFNFGHSQDSEQCHFIHDHSFGMHCSSQQEPDSSLDGSQFEFTAFSESRVKEECSNIAGSCLDASVAEFSASTTSKFEEYEKSAEENRAKDPCDNLRADSRKFIRGRCVHPFRDSISEAEKVDLRHQMIQERKAAEEWMLDYALTKVVKKLSPFRDRKVELLVEAFETVMPLTKCETSDLKHGTTDFTHIQPIQACN